MNETMAKTFANNAETILLMLGVVLYLYREESPLYDHLMPVCMLVSVIMRGTSVVGWSILVLVHLFQRKDIILVYLYVGYLLSDTRLNRIPCLFLLMVPDYIFYGKWHLLPLNFVVFNVVEGKSNLFGISPRMEYIDGYIPDYLGLLYPFAVLGLVLFVKDRICRREIIIPLILGLNLALYSYAGHKENRFASRDQLIR